MDEWWIGAVRSDYRLRMGKRNRGMSAMINEAAKRLMAGEEGSDVVGFLRAELAVSAERGGRPFSHATLKTYVSHAKSKVLAADFRNPGLGCCRGRRGACEQGVARRPRRLPPGARMDG